MPDILTDTELPPFAYLPQEDETLKKTILNQWHHDAGANMVVFAGWEMPVQYSSILDEHLAVRQAAGLFDVSHMGVFQAEGPSAATFLDCVCGNDISGLDVGHSCYTHFLAPDGSIIDDLIVYRRAIEKFLVVVNAANTDIDWQWLIALKNGSVLVDKARPSARVYGRDVILKNLHDLHHGNEMLVDIALQGAKSMDILLHLGVSPEVEKQIRSQKRSTLIETTIKDYDLVISRTGYTGENMGYEIFIHPDQAVKLWQDLVDAGQPLGLKPCGLGARDSLRTEYGLPLYGHEMDGPLDVTVGEAGFAYFVKTYKPWFIGREAFMEQEATQKRSIVRFRFVEQRTRKAHLGDPVMNERGKVIGQVTSCAVATDGFFTGQAVIDSKYDKKDSTIYIYQGAPQNVSKAPAALSTGDQVILPSPAVILSRYMVFGRSK
jgi:glycine hydroxymethyltransferase